MAKTYSVYHFFRGIRKISYFLFTATITSHDSQLGKDRFSQIGMRMGSSVCASGLAYKLYLNVSGVILQAISRLPSFSTWACNTK